MNFNNYISLEHNNRLAHLWDIEEDDGFKFINGYKINVKFSEKNADKAAKMLYFIDRYIQALQKCCESVDHPHCKLFATTQHILQEISYDNQLTKYGTSGQKFEGINKPKGIEIFNNPWFRDQYKCSWRLVMLALRKKNSKQLRAWGPMKKLLLHELAHTMCNHILYYDKENHEDDFDRAEAFLKDCAKTDKLKSIENEIVALTK